MIHYCFTTLNLQHERHSWLNKVVWLYRDDVLSCLTETELIFGDFANLVVMFKRLLNLVGKILQ